MTEKQEIVYKQIVDLLLINRVIDNVPFSSVIDTAKKICVLLDIEDNTSIQGDH